MFKKLFSGILKSGKKKESPKKQNNSQPPPINRNTTSDSSQSSQVSPIANTPSSSEIFSQQKLPEINKSNISNNGANQQQNVEYNLSNDTDENVVTSSFFSSKQSDLKKDYMESFDLINSKISHSISTTNSEYNTVSSISSTSHRSLEDALFSYISSDSMSEISSYSDESPKITVRQSYENEQSGAETTARIIDSLFDSDYQVGNYNKTAATNGATRQGDFFDTISEYEDLPTNKSQWENYFVKLYLSASRAASEPGAGYAQAFLMFEFISNKGGVFYEKLTDKAKKLVSFAQYRVGTMLYEAMSDQYDTQALGSQYLREARRHGNYHATYYLGYIAYQSGDLETAYDYFYEVANKGYLPAMVSFGHYVLFRNNGNHSEAEALRLLHLAEQFNHPFASLSLAIYFDLCGEPNKALPYCGRLNISKNSPIYGISYYCISIIHFKTNDFHKAFEYMELSSQSGYVNAKRKLGLFFLNGVGVRQKNPVHAFNLIKEAANEGDHIAEIILGQFYMEGLGCKVDFLQAIQIFQRRDHIAAKITRAKLFLDKNPEYALTDLREIIQRTDPSNGEDSELDGCWNVTMIRNEARLLVAVCTLEGTGGRARKPRDAIKELHYLADVENYPVAQYRLGIIYSDTVTQDEIVIQEKQDDKAFDYFLKGARNGNPDCQFKIGSMLHNGIKKNGLNKENAFEFFEFAANQDHVLAQTSLGMYYYTGTPQVPKNHELAFKLFNSAAGKGDDTAILYLADFLINDKTSHEITPDMVFFNLLKSTTKNKKDAYRMLGLICLKGFNFMEHYGSILTNEQQYQEIFRLYNKAKSETSKGHNIHFQFALNCFWKAIQLKDRLSGERICNCIPRMRREDLIYTIECFESVEEAAVSRMSLTHAQFLNAAGEHNIAMKKFQEIVKGYPVNSNTGRKTRLEICRLVLHNKIGKTRLKTEAFKYLKEIIEVSTTHSDMSEPQLLLGKACDQEICRESDCKPENAISHFEKGLKYNSPNDLLQIYARMKLIKFYYENMDVRMLEHLEILERLVESQQHGLTDQEIGQIRYYRGIYTLHDKSNTNRRVEAIGYLRKSAEKNIILAKLELGYAHSVVFEEEDLAHRYFDEIDSLGSTTGISLVNRRPENDILLRKDEKQSDKDITTMKLAAAITYGYHNLVHQAINWLNEIPNNSLARILLLYFQMSFKNNRNIANAEALRAMIGSYEEMPRNNLEYCETMMLSLCNLRLGQCVEENVLDNGNPDIALDYYNKSENFDGDNCLVHEKLFPFMRKMLPRTDLIVFLLRAIRKDKQNSSFEFELSQIYHDDKEGGPKLREQEIEHLTRAAILGHTKANYLYGLKVIKNPKSKGMKSKTAAKHLQFAANNNYGPAYFELSKMKIKAGFYRDAMEDLEEADFLGVADASYYLGEIYYNGFFGVLNGKIDYRIPISYSDAIKHYKKAVNLNHPEALVKLGSFYELAIGVNRDLKKAYSMYQRAIVENCPNGAGEYALGCWIETMLDSDINCKYTPKDAYDWFEKARNAKNEDAKFKVALYLIYGKISDDNDNYGGRNKEKDKERGLQLLNEQSKIGINKAILELARYHESNGKQEEAKGYWMRAVNVEDPDALEHFEMCYREGLLGFEIDIDKSLEYKDKALKARKSALENQCSFEGFKSDPSFNDGKKKKK